MTTIDFEVEVRWSDLDEYGHVNNVMFMEYLQEARVSFIADTLGVGDEDRGAVVARMQIDYRAQMRYRAEPYLVRASVSHVGRSSFVIEATIVDSAREGATVYATSRATLVAFNPAKGASRPLEDDEREALSRVCSP